MVIEEEMNKEDIAIDVKDLLCRIEGTINVLHKPDVLLADRKLQGIRDKLKHLLFKIVKAPTPNEADELIEQLRSINSSVDNSE